MSGQGPLVEVENLKVWFPIKSGLVLDRHVGDVRAVDDVSLTIDRGETLSISIATAVYRERSQIGPEIELGVHVLFGVLGVVVSHAPRRARAEWILGLRIRVF